MPDHQPLIAPAAVGDVAATLPEDLLQHLRQAQSLASSGLNLWAARSDHDAVAAFLRDLEDTAMPTTRARFKIDLERFLRWMVANDFTLATVTKTAIREYSAALLATGPVWMPPSPRRKVRPLKGGTAELAITSLKVFFRELVAHHYLLHNPLPSSFHAVSKEARQKEPRRAVPEQQWFPPTLFFRVFGFVFRQTRTAQHAQIAREQAYWERARFVFVLLYELGLRISEAAALTTGDIRTEADGLTLRVVGKGNKVRWLPVSTRLAQAIARYRQFCGLAPEPVAVPALPFLPVLYPVKKDDHGHVLVEAGIGRKMAHVLIKEVLVKFDGGVNATPVASLRSAHAFRHTRLSHIRKHLNPELHMEFSGHANYQTTLTYYHEQRGALRRALQQKQHVEKK